MGDTYMLFGFFSIIMFGIIICVELPVLTKRHYDYKELQLKENEKTNQESIILAQKVAEREKEAEKTKQLQIKAEYEEKYRKTLYNV